MRERIALQAMCQTKSLEYMGEPYAALRYQHAVIEKGETGFETDIHLHGLQ